ncbi:MAG TPA: VanZ family protein [Solirubrobacterales bacterium]|nr:VanZ family protein [Solirubrobacterales bacterium]
MRGMNAIARTAIRAPAPVALMALIFLLSSQPDLDSGLGAWDLVLRKLAHALVFGSLALLWWWALRPLIRKPLPVAAAITLLYAIGDEYHQSFVEGRNGSVLDVCIDLGGIVIAALVLRYDHRVRSLLERDGGSSERGVALPGDRRPADGPGRRSRSARRPLRGRGDGLRKGRPPAPD